MNTIFDWYIAWPCGINRFFNHYFISVALTDTFSAHPIFAFFKALNK